MLSRRRFWFAALGLPLSLLLVRGAQAFSFVDLLRKNPVGREQAQQYGWPKGALALADHPLRTQGWYRFFSECPNDVYVFGYRLRDTGEANQLLQTLGGFEKGQARLFVLAEPDFRWDRETKEGYEASFALGSQKILDEWWKQLPDGRFGVNVYKVPPKAMVPRLSLYVGGGKIDLRLLQVPEGVQVAVPSEADLRKEGVSPELITKLRTFAAAHAQR